ncbi:MAG TPA: ribonuclease III [Candidatus Dormibacteraeota bacterium]|nr:ribonuclease III [Candidatus Dormibacteraeota bacterium]
MTEEERKRIEAAVGLHFHQPELLECALTHRSFRVHDSSSAHNELLEFLGDAVLGLILGEFLVRQFPGWTEGNLSKARARLASAHSLYEASRRLGLGKFLRLGPSEEKTGGREKRTLLANAFEAMTAAVYLDQGLEAAAGFVKNALIRPVIERPSDALAASDHKSALQEWLQARGLRLAEYRVVGESGPDHAKSFLIEVEAGGRVLAQCEGRTKKEAEQEAAAQALGRLHQEAGTEAPTRG